MKKINLIRIAMLFTAMLCVSIVKGQVSVGKGYDWRDDVSKKAATLHIYSGSSHDVYLGCLNCSSSAANSIWNENGKYGNRYNPLSIWNEYGEYGNEYNPYCPWNEYSTTPPIIVDNAGGFYGYFTINEYKAKRANFGLVITIYKNYQKIREDVDDWYNKIFY